jgi:uncharacterized protein (TIGR02246 family)
VSKHKSNIIIFIFNIILLTNLATMDRQEIAIMIHRQAVAWKNENIEAIVTDFAQDGLFVAGNQKLKGKEAIKKAAEN